MHGQTDAAAGYRLNFSEGQVSGKLSTSLKASAIYKHMLEFGALTF